MLSASVCYSFWRRADGTGHDACRLVTTSRGLELEGFAVFIEAKQLCQLLYSVRADESGATRRATVVGDFLGQPVDLEIKVSQDHRWTVNGTAQPLAQGCIDIDLPFTPATNLLPLRRLGLHPGQSAAAPAAFIDLRSAGLTALAQTYHCLSSGHYAYAAPRFGYQAVLCVSPEAFVIEYPGLFSAIQMDRNEVAVRSQ